MTQTEQRLKEAIKNLRKAAKDCDKYIKKEAKEGKYYDAIRLREWKYGINWTLDNLEEYIKKGRML